MVTRAPKKPVETAYALVETTGITQHPDNPRHDVGDVTDLAASITEHGLLEPLVVIPTSDLPTDVKGTTKTRSALYVLIAGHRRLAAARQAKVKTVPVLVRHDLTTREAQVAAMVIENQHRADLSPLEEGEAYQLLLDITPKATQAQVAKTVGMPRQRVSERLRLTKLPDRTRDAVHARQITITEALEVARLADRVPALAEQLEEKAGTKDFAVELERAKRQASGLEDVQHCRDTAEECGTKVVSSIPDGARYLFPGQQPMKGLADVEWEDRAGGKPSLIRAHAECPGALVRIPKNAPNAWQVDVVCTAWDEVHAPTPEEQEASRQEWQEQRAAAEAERIAAMPPEEKAEHDRRAAEAEARQQAAREREETLAAAATVRLRHLADVARAGDKDLARWCVHDLHATEGRELSGWEWATVASTLLNLDIPDGTSPADIAPLAAEKVAGYPLERSVILLWLLVNDIVFRFLERGPNGYEKAEEYEHEINALTDRFGYEWSDAELEIFGLDEFGHVAPADEDEGGDDA